MVKPVKNKDDKKKTETRAHAEQAIAQTSDSALLESERFTKHANKHVRTKAAFKLRRTT